jgi:tetratricopeptide (TPR) repeat protein
MQKAEGRNQKNGSFVSLMAFAVLSGAIVFAGCSKKATEPTTPSVDELMTSAWNSFHQGYFSSALDNFNQVLSQNSAHSDALNGKGWCLGILGNRPGALAAFNAGLAAAPSSNSLRAGLAFTYAAMDSGARAVTVDSTALASDSLWSLGHRYVMSWDYLMDWRDLRVLLAEELFELGRFAESLAQVKKLDPSVSVGTDFSLPENQAALLVEIERLSMTYK